MNSTITVQQQARITQTERWRGAGEEFIQRSESFLWNETGLQPLKYLHALGLKDETLRKYRVGYNPKQDFEAYEHWGLPPTYNNNGNLKRVWLPRGIVIPCFLDDVLQSIRILRYLTQEQKLKGEQPYYTIKGSNSWLFGAENLRNSQLAIFTDDELDAMLLDQEVGDVAGVVAIERVVHEMDVRDLAKWSRYLLFISHFLIPYNQDHKIHWSITSETKRAHRVCLSDSPNIKTFVDLLKSGQDLREWLVQELQHLDLVEGKNNKKPGKSSAIVENEISDYAGALTSEFPSQVDNDECDGDINRTQKWVTINLDAPWLVDPKIMPVTSCYCCQNDKYWQRPDGGWVCSVCHPNPANH